LSATFLTLVVFVALVDDLDLVELIAGSGTLQAAMFDSLLFYSVFDEFLLDGVLGLVLFLVQIVILLFKEFVDVSWLGGMLILSDFDLVQETMLVVVSHSTEGYPVQHGEIVQHFLIFGDELIVIELVSQLLHQVLRERVVDVGSLVLQLVVAVS
jgi:hypothetical protein